jgi:hypothetical protein
VVTIQDNRVDLALVADLAQVPFQFTFKTFLQLQHLETKTRSLGSRLPILRVVCIVPFGLCCDFVSTGDARESAFSFLLAWQLLGQRDLVHIVATSPVEPPEDVHATSVHHRTVECSGRRDISQSCDVSPRASFEIELAQVREASLPLVHATKDKHAATVDDGTVAIS